jgi:hypothetical protein
VIGMAWSYSAGMDELSNQSIFLWLLRYNNQLAPNLCGLILVCKLQFLA